MMNIKEKFGCETCNGAKVVHEIMRFDKTKEQKCPACNGSGYSNAKILARFGGKNLEDSEAGCRIVEAMKKELPVSGISVNDNKMEYFEDSWDVTRQKDGTVTQLYIGADLNAALNRLLGEEKEG